MASKARKSMTYAQSGVDIDKADSLVDHLKTINPAIGGFSGLFPLPRGMKNPRLVAATDGVGTKLLVAQMAKNHATIGIDLVAMSVNDLIVCGAKPLFFLDYFATGHLKNEDAKEVISGIVEGCDQAMCPLIGGETAEMPGMYSPGHYDLAGFCVGAVEAKAVVDGSRIAQGDVIIGLGSNGLHSNGYSLARKALLGDESDACKTRAALRRKLYKGGPTVADAMLTPTRIYVKTVLDLCKKFDVKGAAHITGGGIAGNLIRVLPQGVRACIERFSWEVPAIFEAIAEGGPVASEEMFKVFNMGIGFILVVPGDQAKKVVQRARRLGEQCEVIGWIDKTRRAKAKPEVLMLDQAV